MKNPVAKHQHQNKGGAHEDKRERRTVCPECLQQSPGGHICRSCWNSDPGNHEKTEEDNYE